ncbi:MAG: TonB-dependent receptor [Cyclobacteriaceae bacterium]|nr:TonB-dependent receptor [Cyclobacteriaceae bacterium]
MRNFLVMVSISIFSPNLFGQDTLSTTMLRDVIVSASRNEQSVMQVPRSVSVIDHQTLEKSIYSSVGELLAAQEGMYVVGSAQTPGSNQSVFLRGSNSNQVAVMIDGMRINDPSTPNAVIDLSELSLSDVERVEIVRGSHSTLYGGSAVGGIINIITRKDEAPGFHGRAAIQSGTFGSGSFSMMENLDLKYTMKNGLYVTGSLIDQRVNGLNATLDTIQSPGVYKTTDRDNFRKTDTYIKTGFHNEHWKVSAFYKTVNQRADIDAGAFQDDDNSDISFTRDLVNYAVEYSVNNHWKISALGSWSQSSRLNINDSSVMNVNGDYDGNYFRGRYTGRLLTNEFQSNFKKDNLAAVFGIGQYQEQMDFNTYYFSNAFGPFEWIINYDTISTSTATSYAFGQLQWRLKNFVLSAGGRVSHHSIFGQYWTAEINPSYRLRSQLLLYASLSSGYNAPSLNQLFDPTQNFGAFATRGNKALLPEESLSVEVGIKKEFQSGSQITLSAYRNRVNHLIEYVYLWDKNSETQNLSYNDYLGDTYLNFSQHVVVGAELTARAVLGKQIFIQGNFSWLTGKLRLESDEVSVQQTGGNHVQLYNYGTFVTGNTTISNLVRRPDLMFSGQVQYLPSIKISLMASYRFVGPRPDSFYDAGLGPFGALNQVSVSRYHLVDVNATWKITKSVLLGLRLENVLNETYQEILGFQTRGRSWYMKIAFAW